MQSWLPLLLLLLPQTNLVDRSKDVAKSLDASQYATVVEDFDDTMRKALPVDSLSKTWALLHKQMGKLKQTGKTRQVTADPYEVVFVECEFENGKLELKLVYDKSEKIAGMFMLPVGSYTVPKYAKPEDIVNRTASLGRGILNVPGTLMLPKSATATAPVPAVVLVHGSGPQDRDETIGPNKPFLDIAHGLAARGIAVLRYEKRTRHYATVMALQASSLTVKQETIDDVAYAVEYLKSQPEIDKRRIIVVGHSLGGMLLPRIAQRTPDAAGYVGLAGSARPLEDLIVQQTEEIMSKQPQLSDEDKAELEKLKKQVALVKSPELTRETKAEDLPLGIPAAYWLDLRGYEPHTEAKQIDKPILLLHAGRDYQVTEDDWKLWQAALKDRPNCTLKLLPNLNHLFMTGQGRSTPQEYMQEGHVDEEAITALAEWIGAVGGKQ
jgi:dienelactone hydrolase